MVVEFHGPRAVLDIPKHTRHVAGRRDDLPVVDEAAAAQVPRVCAQLSGDLDLSALRAWSCASEGVDGADVIEPAAGHEVAGGCIRAGHDPRRAEWDGVDLVCGVGVPHDELAVLGCGDDMAPVCCPVEGVDLCEVALESSADLECDAGEGGGVACHGADWLSAGGGGGDSRLVSAVWSRAALILSLSPSASRLAAAIFSWISADMGEGGGGGGGESYR